MLIKNKILFSRYSSSSLAQYFFAAFLSMNKFSSSHTIYSSSIEEDVYYIAMVEYVESSGSDKTL
jgi:hypothetical protein